VGGICFEKENISTWMSNPRNLHPVTRRHINLSISELTENVLVKNIIRARKVKFLLKAKKLVESILMMKDADNSNETYSNDFLSLIEIAYEILEQCQEISGDMWILEKMCMVSKTSGLPTIICNGTMLRLII